MATKEQLEKRNEEIEKRLFQLNGLILDFQREHSELYRERVENMKQINDLLQKQLEGEKGERWQKK